MAERAMDLLPPAGSAVPQTAVEKTTQSQATSITADNSESGTPSASRLVIRITIPDGAPTVPVRRRWSSTGALLVVLVTAAVLLVGFGISIFRAETSVPAAPTAARNSESQSSASVSPPHDAAPVVSNAPLPKPAAETAETRSPKLEPTVTKTTSVAPEVGKQPDVAPSPINEVIPEVSRSARETIRGTIRVSIRVIVDKDGKVVDATADEPGPSRYFARLATEAAKKWTFGPADSEAQRVMLVRFYFKRDGTTASAKPSQ